MARILILGGGFGGVVAAESLARQIPEEHQITLVSLKAGATRFICIRAYGMTSLPLSGKAGFGPGPSEFTINTG